MVPGDEGTLPLASRVAIWCKDAGIDTDDDRHAFLEQFSHRAYRSARDVPASDVKRLRAVLALRAAFRQVRVEHYDPKRARVMVEDLPQPRAAFLVASPEEPPERNT